MNTRWQASGEAHVMYRCGMYGSAKHKLNGRPDDAVLYISFYRKDRMPKKVMLRIQPEPVKLKERMCLSEHPFRTVKWYHSTTQYLLCKGKEKATADIRLPCV